MHKLRAAPNEHVDCSPVVVTNFAELQRYMVEPA